jgi:hypothetical protein
MRIFNWLRSLAVRVGLNGVQRGPQRPRFRPCVEGLEERAVPAVYNLPSGAIAWWRAQGNAADSIGGHDGTLVNGTTFASGVFGGQAFHFDTTQHQGVLIPDSPSLDPTDALTLEAWVNPSSLPNAFPTVFRKDFPGTGNAQYAITVSSASDQAAFGWVSDGVNEFAIGGSVPLNTWSFLVGTYDGSTIRMYVNGSEVGSKVVVHPLRSGTGTLAIGRQFAAEDRDFDGLIAEPAIFNRALSAEEIQAQYRGSVSPVFDSLAGPTITYGTPSVTLSGHIAAAGVVPPGSVDVTLNGVTQHAAIDPTSGNFATAFSTASLPVSGSPYAITYSYAGATGFDTATDSTKTVTITRADTAVHLTASATSPLLGDPVTFTSTVTSNSPGSPGGTVDFFDTSTGTDLGTFPLVNGAAALSTSALAAGGHTITASYSGDENFLSISASTSLTVLAPSSLSGIVWEDFNDNGQVDFGERGIAGVMVTLAGTDDLGNAVNLCQTTDADGYVFSNLRQGRYTITETQPSGYLQGTNSVGTAGGSLVATDQFFVELDVPVDGYNYNFGERPPAGGDVQHGQTAGIGFWNNRNGQALIKALNGGGASTQLGDWLAATLPHIFGSSAGGNDLTGKSNADVAALFQRDFLLKGVKLDAQVLATALSVYATNATLDATHVAAQYGFTVSGDGVGIATVNVGSNGDSFGVADNTTMTVLDLLLATDAQAVNGLLYNGNSVRRSHANNVYSFVNQTGDIV